ncbi:MAG: insulinase family protein, partial [Bacteroidota bacterium]
MIEFDEFTLDNGLRVLVHTDRSVPIVATNILYNVGSRDEDENKTGFAHLFEHLMFGGSVNIPTFDEPLQIVGGEN